MINRRTLTLSGIALGLLATLDARAQSVPVDAYPGGVVRITNPFPAGSGPDVVSRWIGERLGKTWNQPVVIYNRPGSSGFVALQSVKQVVANGHDLFLAAADHMAINPALFKKLPYSPTADFVPVSGLYRTSFLVLVSANGPIRTVPELVAFARSGENKASYGSQAVGSPLHLGGAQIEAAIQARMLHVPFKETSSLYQSVANGEVTWALGSLGSAGALIQSGRLRVLAIADTQRSAAMPDVPTLAEAGGPSVSVPTWVALFAPAGTSPQVVNRIRESVHIALDTPEVRSKLMGFGFLPAKASGAEVSDWIRNDQVHYTALVKQTGATVD